MPTTVLVDLSGSADLDGSLPPGMVDAVAALNEFDDASGAPISVAFTGTDNDVAEAGLRGATIGGTTFGDVSRAIGTAPGDTIAVTSDAHRAADARGRGMRVVQIGGDVRAWADVPRAVARIVDPGDTEGRLFEHSLQANGQISDQPGGSPSTTHHRESNGKLRRDRFRAI